MAGKLPSERAHWALQSPANWYLNCAIPIIGKNADVVFGGQKTNALGFTVGF